jgi:deazaflavin-dependent oxidoreductase (nitroreductase family)
MPGHRRLGEVRECGDQLACGAFAFGERVEQHPPVRFGDSLEDVHAFSMHIHLYRRKSIESSWHAGCVVVEYRGSGPLRRVARLLVTTRPVAWLSARYLPTIDRVVFGLTSGTVTPSALLTGLPVVEVATIGARTGLPRTVRLLGIPDGADLLLVAANFGQPTNPAWYYNLRACRRVTVTAYGTSGEYDVTELTGSQRDAGFDRALTLNPGWRRFRDRAGSRQIPVLRLAPAR